MKLYSKISHKDLEICSPVPWETYKRLLSSVAITSKPKILDVGCGKCGVLANAIDFLSGEGVGVDLPDSLATEPTALGKRLLDEKKLKVFFQDAVSFLKENKRSFDLVICIGSSHALAGLQNALKQFQSLLSPSGVLLFGELIWKREPSADFIKFLGCKKDDHLLSHELESLIKENDFEIIAKELCSDEDFEKYERSLKNSIERWCKENPDSEQVEKYRHRSNLWWEARNTWARDEFSFEVILTKKITTGKNKRE